MSCVASGASLRVMPTIPIHLTIWGNPGSSLSACCARSSGFTQKLFLFHEFRFFLMADIEG
jgi:hypothetical protein